METSQQLAAMQGAAFQGLSGLGQFNNLYAAERDRMLSAAQYDAFRRGGVPQPSTVSKMRSEVKEWLKDWKD